jgi:hypothetical protein
VACLLTSKVCGMPRLVLMFVFGILVLKFVTCPTMARSKLGMILETYYSSIQKHCKSLYAKRSFQNCLSVSLNPKLYPKSPHSTPDFFSVLFTHLCGDIQAPLSVYCSGATVGYCPSVSHLVSPSKSCGLSKMLLLSITSSSCWGTRT